MYTSIHSFTLMGIQTPGRSEMLTNDLEGPLHLLHAGDVLDQDGKMTRNSQICFLFEMRPVQLPKIAINSMWL